MLYFPNKMQLLYYPKSDTLAVDKKVWPTMQANFQLLQMILDFLYNLYGLIFLKLTLVFSSNYGP